MSCFVVGGPPGEWGIWLDPISGTYDVLELHYGTASHDGNPFWQRTTTHGRFESLIDAESALAAKKLPPAQGGG